MISRLAKAGFMARSFRATTAVTKNPFEIRGRFPCFIPPPGSSPLRLQFSTTTGSPQFQRLLAQAANGNIGAQCEVALLYSVGSKEFGVVPDAVSAFEWNKKAAESGSIEAQAALGMLYYQGHGCTQDMTSAYEWTLKAADQGLVDAQSIVGDMLHHGLGVEVDKKKAFYYTKQAALQEHKFSQIKLASMYLMGDGVQSDVDEAKSWARKATGEEIDFVNPGQWLHDKMQQMMDEEAGQSS
ncbi:hypothetical protein BDR26DRAFT_851847 [Obelidium mucronatum]|nr:hypothetical protein BDR26DRAFT_851847 [Obelidium mucronatum]